jgi:hypothetical protein
MAALMTVNRILKTIMDEMDGSCSTQGEVRSGYNILVGKLRKDTTRKM